MSIRPSPLTLRLLGLWLAGAIAASWWPALTPLWIASGAALLACMLVDALLLVRSAGVDVERTVAPSIAVGVWSPVALRIRPAWRRGFRAEIFDDAPSSMSLRGQPRAVRVPQGDASAMEIRYHVLPT